MRTVRRLYFYGVATVSLEVVIWGVVGLVRTILNLSTAGLTASLLAGPISLVLVGLPVFLIHWWTVQREALRDPDERTSRLRSVFLYGVLAGSLVPAVQNLLAAVNRLWMAILGLGWQPLIGRGQTWTDNLVAIVINLAAAAYFWTILRADWEANPSSSTLIETRRLYRYLWVIYALGITAFGTQQVLRYILYTPAGITGSISYLLSDGLALLLVGAPLWVFTWRVVQNALGQPGENGSLIRLVVLYLLSLAGVVTVLAASSQVLGILLAWMLGEPLTFVGILERIGGPLSIAVPLGTIWGYYSRWLKNDLENVPERAQQAGLRRLYIYILSALGLAATFIGMQQVLTFIVDSLLNTRMVMANLPSHLASPLAVLAVGLPLWWVNWWTMQIEAGLSSDSGDHARRSVIRKSYLYLALFAGVIGVMVTTGQLLYLLIRSLLGEQPADFANSTVNWLKSMLLFALWLAYHIRVLRLDGRKAARILANRHALFPVLVLDDSDGSFSREMSEALQKQAPGIPVAVQLVSQGIPPAEMNVARLVILPSSLMVHTPEAFRLWFGDFKGDHMVVPAASEGWIWAGSLPRNNRELVQQVAQAVRQMAEGQPGRFPPPLTGLLTATYILLGLFLLPLILVVIALIVNTLGR